MSHLTAPILESPSFDRAAALVFALRARFAMDEEDANAIAEVVLEHFEAAGGHEVNDDTIDPEVRSIFYTLEAKKLLSFRREEYTWENGERRRAFHWRIRDDELVRIQEESNQVVEEDVYATLPRELWARRT